MNKSSTRLRAVPAAGERFLVGKSDLRTAAEECVRQIRERLLEAVCADLLDGVRRLVNMRLKGNGIFWTVDSAEAVLQLRAQLLSGRWNHFMKEILRAIDHWEVA